MLIATLLTRVRTLSQALPLDVLSDSYKDIRPTRSLRVTGWSLPGDSG